MRIEDVLANSEKLFIFSTRRKHKYVQKLAEELASKYKVPTGTNILILNVPLVVVRYELDAYDLTDFINLLKQYGVKEKKKDE